MQTPIQSLAASTGPTASGASVGKAPYPGMVWNPQLRGWAWPQDSQESRPVSETDQALAALRAATTK